MAGTGQRHAPASGLTAAVIAFWPPEAIRSESSNRQFIQ